MSKNNHADCSKSFISIHLLPVVLALIAVSGFCGTAFGQAVGVTPLGLSAGVPAGSEAISGLENINLFNGNFVFRLPVHESNGRGVARMTSYLSINPAKWNVQLQTLNCPPPPPGAILPPPCRPKYYYIPVGSITYPSYGIGGMVARSAALDPIGCSNTTTSFFSTTITRIFLTTSDGTEHEFRDQLTGGLPQRYITCADPLG